MENNLLTVKEFAEKAGVSTQAIYQRLDKDLRDYCKVIGKRKMLDIRGLELFQKQEPLQAEKQEDSKEVDKELIKTLQATLQTLTEQLAVKDRQIEALNERLAEALATTSQSHYLAAQAQQQITAGQEAAVEAEVVTAESKRKRSWFSRLFGG